MAIATLIAAGRLDDRLVDRALGLLREVDPKASFSHWIDEGDAADLRLRRRSARAARWALAALEDVDVVVQPDEPRWKRLFVADMDSTIIGQECIDELADYAGLKDEVARITERAMQGELDFRGALARAGAAARRARPARARPLPRRARADHGRARRRWSRRCAPAGASCLLVSGGFLSFAEPVARTVGFDRVKANRLVFAGGKLSGEVGDPIVDAMAKRDALIEARDQLGLRARGRAGDRRRRQRQTDDRGSGAGDRLRAKPALAEVADAELRHHGLDALLWVQGVRRRTGSAAELFGRGRGSRPGPSARRRPPARRPALRTARPAAG